MGLDIKKLGIVLSLLALAACSQARSGIGRGKSDKFYQAQEVCQNLSNHDLLGCFEVEPNISKNEANISVLGLEINPMEVPYRVLARTATGNSFKVMADNLRVDTGGRFVVDAPSKTYIEEYVEWRFETSVQFASDGIEMVPAKAGAGIPMAQVMIHWPELDVLEKVQ